MKLEQKRWHVFTNEGRKIVLAPSSRAARRKAEAYNLEVSRVVSAPNPLEDFPAGAYFVAGDAGISIEEAHLIIEEPKA